MAVINDTMMENDFTLDSRETERESRFFLNWKTLDLALKKFPLDTAYFNYFTWNKLTVSNVWAHF